MISAKRAEFLAKIGFPIQTPTIEDSVQFEKIQNLKITELNAIYGDCLIRNSTVKSLPAQVAVVGNLTLENVSGLNGQAFKMPERMGVDGDLRISGVNAEMPKGLTVKGNLELNLSGIKALPSNLEVGGTMDLRYTDISEIPEGVRAGAIVVDDFATIKIPDSLDKSKITDRNGQRYQDYALEHSGRLYCVSVVEPGGLETEGKYQSITECLQEAMANHAADFATGKRIDIVDSVGDYAASCRLSEDKENVEILYYENKNIDRIPLDAEVVQEIKDIQEEVKSHDVDSIQKESAQKDDVER